MRNREEVVNEMLIAARPSESDKYLLRLLKASLLQVELLLDIRDLLTGQPKPMTLRQVIVDYPPRKDEET